MPTEKKPLSGRRETKWAVQVGSLKAWAPFVHPCTTGWAPARNPWHRKRGPCPSYGVRAGRWMVAFHWQATPVNRGDKAYLRRIENELQRRGQTTVLPVEEP